MEGIDMNKDQLLHEKLSELESGKPVAEILQDLPGEMSDIGELIMLASKVQQNMQPTLSHEAARKQFEKVRISLNTQKTTKSQKWQWAILSMVLALLFIVTISAGAFIFWTAQPVNAASLDNIQGVVAVKTVNGDWTIGENNTRIKEGSILRSYADSTAEIKLPDGSVIVLDPDTQISIDKLSWKRNGTLEFLVSTISGGITNTVVPLRGSISYYHVRTPGGLVSVHGTEFQVYALDNDQSIVSVLHGNVLVENPSGEVDLNTGQMTFTNTAGAPQEPHYSFNYTGRIESTQEDGLSLDGTNIVVTDDTKAVNQPEVNSTVHVIGHFDTEGNQVADLIVPGNAKHSNKVFTGTVTAISDSVWTVGSSQVTVLPETKVNGKPEVDSIVRVWFHINEDGTWNADKIVNAKNEKDIAIADSEEEIGDDTGDVTLTPSPAEDSTATVSDGTLEPTLPVGTPTPEGRTTGICGSESEQPHAVTLAERYGTTYDVIMGWFCKNNGFGEIDLAYQLSNEFGKSVDEIFEMRGSGMGWGTIRQELEGRERPTKEPKVERTKRPH
jgi:hypothetical protein